MLLLTTLTNGNFGLIAFDTVIIGTRAEIARALLTLGVPTAAQDEGFNALIMMESGELSVRCYNIRQTETLRTA